MGRIKRQVDFDWAGADSSIQRAIALEPGVPENLGRRLAAFHIRMSALAYNALGRERESDAALRELIEKYHSSAAWSIASVYALRNQGDEAFKWLERAYAQHDGGLIFLRNRPRAKELAQRPAIYAAVGEAPADVTYR